jgi:hypothetical protein
MQTDGNLVLVAPGNRAVWSSRTRGSRNQGAVLRMQSDGNLVVIAPGNRPVWVSRTGGRGRSTLRVQDDGNVVVYGPKGPTWSRKAGVINGPKSSRKPRPIKRLPPAPAPVPGLPLAPPPMPGQKPTPGPSPAPARNLRAEADVIMNKDYNTFIDYKHKHKDQETPFNWHDDGCSGPWVIKEAYRHLFDKPCQQHDFGYRNYGSKNKSGLQLAPNEDMREQIDNRLGHEMNRLCGNRFSKVWQKINRDACRSQALVVYEAVRKFGYSAFFG